MTQAALSDPPTEPQVPPVSVGPSGRTRYDWHRIRASQPITAEGRLRIDRTAPDRGLSGSAAPVLGMVHGHAHRREKPLRIIADPACLILAVPDLPGGRLTGHDRDMLGAARHLADAAGGAVAVLAFGAVRDDLGEAGADRVLAVEGPAFEGYAPEARTEAVAQAVRTLNPPHVLFCDGPTGGGDLGRRVAATLEERAATDVWKIDGDTVVRRAGRGKRDVTRAPGRVLLVAPEVAEPVDDARHEARALDPLDLDMPFPDGIVDLGPVPVDPATVALKEAEFIVAAGNGVTDWDAFHAMARALGAAEGASRVAVDAGNMPRHRQVGATGTLVTARVYLAFGISGAPQHLQGISACEKVIAVNTDPGCDMVKRADLAVIGDAQAVIRELLTLCEGEDAP